jgi:hypothetical protein
MYTGYFTSDNKRGGIENATHNTSLKKLNIEIKYPAFFGLIITCEIHCSFEIKPIRESNNMIFL